MLGTSKGQIRFFLLLINVSDLFFEFLQIPKERSEGASQKTVMKNGKYECQKCYRLFTRVAGIKGHRCNNDDDN